MVQDFLHQQYAQRGMQRGSQKYLRHQGPCFEPQTNPRPKTLRLEFLVCFVVRVGFFWGRPILSLSHILHTARTVPIFTPPLPLSLSAPVGKTLFPEFSGDLTDEVHLHTGLDRYWSTVENLKSFQHYSRRTLTEPSSNTPQNLLQLFPHPPWCTPTPLLMVNIPRRYNAIKFGAFISRELSINPKP